MTREAQFYIVDAFTRSRFQGNPAGVVISQHPLDEDVMLKIAAEFHLETAFLWPLTDSVSDKHPVQYSICYYTHVARIPLCGHDTVAAGVVLAARGELGRDASGAIESDPGSASMSRAVFRSDIGDLPIELLPDGAISMRQALPRYGDAIDAVAIVDAIGLPLGALINSPSRVVSTGTPFLFVGADTASTIDSLSPDMPALTDALSTLEQQPAGVYVWADDRHGATQSVYGRCFAPGAGLPEDPVTGSASGALGAHLFDLGMLRVGVDGTASMQTTQGRAMGRPGNAYVTLIASGGRVASVSVAGHGAVVGEGTLLI